MIATILAFPFAMALFAVSASGDRPAFTFPVDCRVGESCLIQKLVDHDPGPGRSDYRCGTLTTDGHDGIDIRLRTMADMRVGFAVLAARDGLVLRTRDGEPDISVTERTAPADKQAGNGVVIDHGDGWETQYSHLRDGSITVRPGQRVAAGERLGLIGLSGNSEFPHLHFAIRHRGQPVDPFTGGAPDTPCAAAAVPPGLWTPTAALALANRPTAVIAAGLSSTTPPKAVTSRDPPAGLAGPDAPMILWVDAMGTKAGDRQSFVIVGPDGRTVHSQETEVAGGGLSWFAWSGKRAPAEGWSAGRYTGRYVLRRGGDIVAEFAVQGVVE